MTHRFMTFALIALVLVTAPSCVQEVQETTSFGDSLQTMYVSSGSDLVWRHVDLTGRRPYRRLLVEPLRFERTHLEWLASVPAQELGRNRQAYLTAMARALGDGYPLVTRPGPGTLRVVARLTDRVTVPQLFEAVRRARPEVGPDGALPNVALEVEFYECETGELVAALLSLSQAPIFRGNLSGRLADSVLTQAFAPYATRFRQALDRVTRAQSTAD